jgi:hypothetical protein
LILKIARINSWNNRKMMMTSQTHEDLLGQKLARSLEEADKREVGDMRRATRQK